MANEAILKEIMTVNILNHIKIQSGGPAEKLQMENPQNQYVYQITQLHHSIDTTSYSTNACSTMFIATRFMIARKLKQPKCPNTMGYYSALKKNKS